MKVCLVFMLSIAGDSCWIWHMYWTRGSLPNGIEWQGSLYTRTWRERGTLQGTHMDSLAVWCGLHVCLCQESKCQFCKICCAPPMSLLAGLIICRCVSLFASFPLALLTCHQTSMKYASCYSQQPAAQVEKVCCLCGGEAIPFPCRWLSSVCNKMKRFLNGKFEGQLPNEFSKQGQNRQGWYQTPGAEVVPSF